MERLRDALEYAVTFEAEDGDVDPIARPAYSILLVGPRGLCARVSLLVLGESIFVCGQGNGFRCCARGLVSVGPLLHFIRQKTRAE